MFFLFFAFDLALRLYAEGGNDIVGMLASAVDDIFCIYVLKSDCGGGRFCRFEVLCLYFVGRGGGMSGIVETGWCSGTTALASVSVSLSFMNCRKSAEGGECLLPFPLFELRVCFELLAGFRVCFSFATFL